MRVARCLQHVAFEGPGVFQPLLEAEGFRVVPCLVPGEGLPRDPGDLLLVMGGPMSANDPEPWIPEELAFLQRTVFEKVPILGVCLGAQLLARALGASVYRGDAFEIGPVPITLTAEGQRDPAFEAFPPTMEVFQWHGEGFDLPDETVRLAASAAYPNQAFRFGDSAYGLLFHLEVERSGIEALCRECPEDVQRGGVPAQTIRQRAEIMLPNLHQAAGGMIRRLAALGSKS